MEYRQASAPVSFDAGALVSYECVKVCPPETSCLRRAMSVAIAAKRGLSATRSRHRSYRFSPSAAAWRSRTSSIVSESAFFTNSSGTAEMAAQMAT